MRNKRIFCRSAATSEAEREKEELDFWRTPNQHLGETESGDDSGDDSNEEKGKAKEQTEFEESTMDDKHSNTEVEGPPTKKLKVDEVFTSDEEDEASSGPDSDRMDTLQMPSTSTAPVATKPAVSYKTNPTFRPKAKAVQR